MEEMSLFLASLMSHTLGGSMVCLFVALFYRDRSWKQFVFGFFGLVLGSLFIALVLSASPFNPLRTARLLCFGWFLHVPLYLVAVGIRPQLRWMRAVLAMLLIGIISITWYSFRIEPFQLEVSRFTVVSAKVDRPLKIGVLADFQTDHFGDYEKDALRKLIAEKPDLIVMPGDFLQANSAPQWEALRDEMNAFLRHISFSAPCGVYAVGGNTDFRRRWPEIFAGLGFETMLDTRTIQAERFALTGLSVEDSFDRQFRPRSSVDPLHIVLGHAPDFALSPHLRADLMIAGHTHGGQVRLPWIGPLVTFSQVPRSWAAGLTQVQPGRSLIVSRGVGMERRDAPRLRFLCRPQLVIVTVIPNP